MAPSWCSRQRVAVAWAFAVLATVADAATTAVGVGAGLPEGNPFVAAVLATAGVPGFLAVKVLILLAVAAVGARCFERPTVAPAVLAVAWGGVAAVNLVVLAGT